MSKVKGWKKALEEERDNEYTIWYDNIHTEQNIRVSVNLLSTPPEGDPFAPLPPNPNPDEAIIHIEAMDHPFTFAHTLLYRKVKITSEKEALSRAKKMARSIMRKHVNGFTGLDKRTFVK